MLELGVGMYLFSVGCYDVLFGENHYYLYLFAQAIAFFNAGLKTNWDVFAQLLKGKRSSRVTKCSRIEFFIFLASVFKILVGVI